MNQNLGKDFVSNKTSNQHKIVKTIWFFYLWDKNNEIGVEKPRKGSTIKKFPSGGLQ